MDNKATTMDKRAGRFSVTDKTLRIGTEIYRELIKKMLSVHIATMERKMRACVQCPPRCPDVIFQGKTQKHPYTSRFKKLPFRPRKHLPTYVQKKITELEKTKGRPLRVR